jgi:hypothetical protein
MSSSFSSVSTVFLRYIVLSSTDPVVCHFLISLDMQDFLGKGELGCLWMNFSLHSAKVLFHMYVSTKNILWSVVYVTGYKEKDKLLNWAHKYNFHLISSRTDWWATRRRIPEEDTLQNHRCENLKSCMFPLILCMVSYTVLYCTILYYTTLHYTTIQYTILLVYRCLLFCIMSHSKHSQTHHGLL